MTRKDIEKIAQLYASQLYQKDHSIRFEQAPHTTQKQYVVRATILLEECLKKNITSDLTI